MKPIPIDDLPEHLRKQAEKQIYKPVTTTFRETNTDTPPSENDAPERELQRQAEMYFSRLRDAGRIIDYFHLKDARGERAGLPDILVFVPYNGILFFELKSAKGKLRPAQKKFKERAEMLDSDVFIVRSMEHIIEITRERL